MVNSWHLPITNSSFIKTRNGMVDYLYVRVMSLLLFEVTVAYLVRGHERCNRGNLYPR